ECCPRFSECRGTRSTTRPNGWNTQFLLRLRRSLSKNSGTKTLALTETSWFFAAQRTAANEDCVCSANHSRVRDMWLRVFTSATGSFWSSSKMRESVREFALRWKPETTMARFPCWSLDGRSVSAHWPPRGFGFQKYNIQIYLL